MFELCEKVQTCNQAGQYYVSGRRKGPIPKKDCFRFLQPRSIQVLKYESRRSVNQISLSQFKLNKSTGGQDLQSGSQKHCVNSEQNQLSMREIKVMTPLAETSRQEKAKNEAQDYVERNKDLINHLYSTSAKKQREPTCQLIATQKISAKSKPISPTLSSELPWLVTSPTQYQQCCQAMAETKPGASKFEISEAGEHYSEKIIPIEMVQSIHSIHQSIEGDYQNQIVSRGSSRVLSLSNSFSQYREAVVERGILGEGSYIRTSNLDREISVNLSQILSRDSFKSTGQAPNLTSLFNQRHRQTLESRIFNSSTKSMRVEESFVNELNPLQNFILLEQSKIVRKSFTMSLAIEASIGLPVSLKQYDSQQMDLISHELQAYRILDAQYNGASVLAFYQVQIGQSCYVLIKQPYCASLQTRIRSLPASEQQKLRTQAKSIFSELMAMFECHHLHPTRKVTIHDFVMCFDEVKLHDLSVFQKGESTDDREYILAGLDI